MPKIVRKLARCQKHHFFKKREREREKKMNSSHHPIANLLQARLKRRDELQVAATSDVGGVSSVEPRKGRSNKERIHARALAHANREHLRKCQAWMARPFRMRGTERASVFANRQRKNEFHASTTSCLGDNDHRETSTNNSRDLGTSTVFAGGPVGERHSFLCRTTAWRRTDIS